MFDRCRGPVLILEGPGDKVAVPKLIREVLHSWGIFDVYPMPHPITNQSVSKLRRAGELEKFVGYSLQHEGDAALIILDCDEHCPQRMAEDSWRGLRGCRPEKG
jgi:hypothetical protein